MIAEKLARPVTLLASQNERESDRESSPSAHQRIRDLGFVAGG